MIELCISKVDYMDWMSAIIAILALLIMILIGWQIWNYVYFEKKLDKKIQNRLNEAENKLREENKKQIALSNYYSYLHSAISHQNSTMWDINVVLENLTYAINQLLDYHFTEKEHLNPLINNMEILCKRKSFGTNYKGYANAVDKFIPIFKQLLGKDERIYDLLKEMEKQRDNRGELKTE